MQGREHGVGMLRYNVAITATVVLEDGGLKANKIPNEVRCIIMVRATG